MKKLIIISPLVILFFLCSFFLIYLLSGKDPNKPPSALLNKKMPSFESNSLYEKKLFIKNESVKNKKVLINFFASWCTPCKIEHPLFLELASEYPSLFILGFNHKDKQEDAIHYLKKEGDPYDFVGVDSSGLIALEFGVFGLPETFLVDEKGKIIFKYMGPLTKKIIEDEIIPKL